MFKATQDDAYIVDFMSDLGIEYKSFQSDRVTTFFAGDNFHVLLFHSQEGNKGFSLFSVENVHNNLADLELLRDFFKQVEEKEGKAMQAMVEEVLKAVEAQIIIISSLKGSPLYLPRR